MLHQHAKAFESSHLPLRGLEGGEGVRDCDRRAVDAPARPDIAAPGGNMKSWLAISDAIDRLNERIGGLCNWLVLAACLVSAANAMIRYAFSYSSNGYLELQWYMFAILV